jgi:hypothetical protein
MSRSGYTDDCDDDPLAAGRWRGRVASAIRGKRGQAALRETLAALDAMPVKELAAESLVTADGECCTLGALGAARGLDMSRLDPDDPDAVADAFNIAAPLAREIVYFNDEWGWRYEEHPWVMRNHYDHPPSYRVEETPAERWARMRAWVAERITP